MWRYSGIAARFLIYGALFTISAQQAFHSAAGPVGGADRVSVDVRDLPFAFVLVQLRTLQWPLDVQWRWTWLAAEQAFHSTAGVLILVAEAAVLALLSVSWVRGALRARGGAATQTEIAQERVPVWASLVLAWSLLLGSRIVLILQQSISRFDTRLAYGASMGIAVAGVALVSGAIHHRLVGVRLRAMAGPMVLAVVLMLGWAVAGVGVHYANTSQAEAQTLRTLEHWMASSPSPIRGATIVVVAAKSVTAQGTRDLGYFNERDGDFLDYVMKRRCPDCDTFVTEQVDCVGTRNTIAVHDETETDRTQPVSNGRVTLSDQAVFFRWTGQALVPADGACQQR